MRMRTGAMAACARTACPLNNDFCSFSDHEKVMVVGEPLNPHLRQRIFFLSSIRTFFGEQVMVVGEPLNPHLRQRSFFSRTASELCVCVRVRVRVRVRVCVDKSVSVCARVCACVCGCV